LITFGSSRCQKTKPSSSSGQPPPHPQAINTQTNSLSSAGVIGLTTALRLQQSLPKNSHKSILLVARDWPTTTSLNYASPWAGAHYRPVPGKTAQSLREETQAQATYTYFKSACQDAASGIAKVEGVEHLENPPDEYRDQTAIETYYDHLDGFRYLRKEEMPEGVVWGVRYETFVVNSPVYLAYLLRKFILLGGRTREYTLADPREAFYLADGESGNVRTVVNCSGVGFGDEKSFIIRGTPNYFLLSFPRFPSPSLWYESNMNRPNLPRPQPHNNHINPPKCRRNLVLQHPTPARRRDNNRRHKGSERLGPEPVSRRPRDTPRQREEVVSVH
jgi:hypothetical protein